MEPNVGGDDPRSNAWSHVYLSALAAYRTPFGLVVVGGVILGILLALVFADARWLAVGVLGAVVAIPYKLDRLRRSVEASNARQLRELSHTMEQLANEHRAGIKDVGGRLSALGSLHGEREAHLGKLATDVARLTADHDAATDAG